jgi:benzoate membrane transport protein
MSQNSPITVQHWASLTSASAAAVVVGFVSTILVVMQGAAAVGATPAQQASCAAATCFAMAVTTLYLGWTYKMPLIIAWTTPGSALLASSAGAFGDISYAEALGAFVVAGLLMVFTAMFRPLAVAIEKMPAGIAAAMLAGVLFKFVLAVPGAAIATPWSVLPLVVAYFALRLAGSMFAVPVVVGLGVALGIFEGVSLSSVPLQITPLEFTMPEFHWQPIVSIAIPLYLVTMASQNLPGFSVHRAFGYNPPVQACLGVTGIASAVTAPFGVHAVNMAAITASLVAGPDAHPDPARRWLTVFPYFVMYAAVGFGAGTFVATLGVLPSSLVAALAGLALFGPMASGIAAMVKDTRELEPAIITFAVTASGIMLFSVGAAFWGLVAGLCYWAIRKGLTSV